ncbi:hypothetical protein [Streptomyces violascens]|uniref:Uncharacterized protein n=1 Tax=Streptomyces violascens TaxID=67381 RepID=A0ABQ3QGC2_9ACTN|nr:hypothetical protein [Streptomyces violascens]GGT89310.1 hypothetical protein GCM10010289_06710 [Streptomyces violascens]GHI36336.1 hypothetical protein Sviol_07440 [Streptomyces violascens]
MAGPFEAATGDGPVPSPDAGRDAAVRAAFEGLLHIRRVTNASGPAQWERLQPVRAVALALEAAGIEPSAVDEDGRRYATGYRVGATEGATVRVEWLGPPGSGAEYAAKESLRRCAAALRPLGWLALEYRGPRRHHYLEVEPAG